jgi:transaldolase/glucose-6-phosphate isomerase
MSGPRLAPEFRELVHSRIRQLESAGWMQRLWARDPGLWSDDPAHQAVAHNRLGWLDIATKMKPKAAALEKFASAVWAEGYTHAVLLGMGGSSLAPEVLRLTFGAGTGALELSVLDSTSPAAVHATIDARDPARTLFVVSSKSGGTTEVTSFEAYAWERVRAARGEQAGRSFVAITDPGTPLADLAAERGYRRVFENPADIGGRYSALSFFGLVPAALLGVDLAALLGHAEAEMRNHQPAVPGLEQPGLVLGAALGELALRGRDKLTLVLGREILALGSWIEQLIAESTGKDGRGIVPVVGEPLGAPSAYRDDRVFVAVSIDPLPSHTHRALEKLQQSGHPVIDWRVASLPSLGGEFLRWEIATAVASSILGVDPFDEPNVTEAKRETQAVLERVVREGRFPVRDAVAARDGVRAESPASIAEQLRPRVAQPGEPAAWAAALPSLAGAGDYFAILAYLHATPQRERKLETLRLEARAVSSAATTVGYGPRFLHSTGQLHKGGPGTGVFLQLTADEAADAPIPGRPYGFATLIAAQAWGDFEVLERRERRLLRVHLGEDPERALDEIIEALQAARV